MTGEYRTVQLDEERRRGLNFPIASGNPRLNLRETAPLSLYRRCPDCIPNERALRIGHLLRGT
jgi:hypothetical protein